MKTMEAKKYFQFEIIINFLCHMLLSEFLLWSMDILINSPILNYFIILFAFGRNNSRNIFVIELFKKNNIIYK